MIRILPLTVLLSAVCGFATSCAPPGPEGRAEEQMIASARALDHQIVEAINKGDVDAVMATYWNSPALVFYPPDGLELRGWQSVKDALTKSFAQTPGARLELLETNYRVAGDVVIGNGKWRMTMPSTTGAATELLGRYTDVKTERDGKWVYILDHSSAPLPPPPAPAATH
jgi:uncharacterized protein (TIGR02246 family)